MFFITRDVQNTTPILPDGLLWVKDDARVLFNIPIPPLDMARWHGARREPDSFETFASPVEKPSDFFQSYTRRPGEEMFARADWDKGFRWLLIIRDLRPRVSATVVRFQWVLWWQQPKRFLVQLGNGPKAWVPLGVVEPTADGRTQPRKGEVVEIVISRDGEAIDRVWLTGPSD